MRFGHLGIHLLPKAIANEMKALGLVGWRAGLSTFIGPGTLGLCNYDRKSVVLLHSLVEFGPPEAVEEIVIHELGHAVVGPGKGHTKVWANACADLGWPNITQKYEGITLLPRNVTRTVFAYRLCYVAKDGTIELLDEFSNRNPSLRNHQVTGRPETRGRLRWMPL